MTTADNAVPGLLGDSGRALTELGVWLPDRGAAELAVGISLARGLLADGLTVAGCSRQARRIWDFDEVIYPALPGDLDE